MLCRVLKGWSACGTVVLQLHSASTGPVPPLSRVVCLPHAQIELRNSPGKSFGALRPLGIRLPGVIVKPSTQDAFLRRGVDETSKLRLASDKIMDDVLDELIARKMPPFPDQWRSIEEASAMLKAYGETCYPCARRLQKAHCLPRTQLDMHGEVRLERAVEADAVVLAGGGRVSRQEMLRDQRASLEHALEDRGAAAATAAAGGEWGGTQQGYTPQRGQRQRSVYGGGAAGKTGGSSSRTYGAYSSIPEEDDYPRVLSVEEAESPGRPEGRPSRASRDSGIKVT